MYISTSELEIRFDNVYTFGTNGTCWASVGFGTFQIGRASSYIDTRLAFRYGTYNPIFGTNGIGTLEVPELVKSCCADLSLAYCFQNKQLSVTDTEQNWINMIYKRGLDLLDSMVDDASIELTPYAGTQTPVQIFVPSAYSQVRGEILNFNGTNLVSLTYGNVVKDTLRVYGTTTTDPVQYVEGVDYNAWYWNQDNTGTRAGCIAGTGTTGVFTALVDYQYRKNDTFKLQDNYKWGFPSTEARG